MEVGRLVNASGGITLGNQLILVGSPLARQRARLRLDGQLMHMIIQDGVLWRTLPCPIPPGQRHRLLGVRLAGPDPLPEAPTVVQRQVSARDGIQVGMTHAGKTVTVLSEDTSFRAPPAARRWGGPLLTALREARGRNSASTRQISPPGSRSSSRQTPDDVRR